MTDLPTARAAHEAAIQAKLAEMAATRKRNAIARAEGVIAFYQGGPSTKPEYAANSGMWYGYADGFRIEQETEETRAHQAEQRIRNQQD